MAFSFIGRKKTKDMEPRLVMSEVYVPVEVERTVEKEHIVKTIYINKLTTKNWSCPYCEGENSTNSTVCCICKKDMKTN